MISSISGFLNLNNLDMTSDANDVIVVRHSDGRLLSTPFNVRFGKVKVLSPSDKVVLVEVNGVMTSAVMKMGPDGEAFWLSPTCANMVSRPESPVNPPPPDFFTSLDSAAVPMPTLLGLLPTMQPTSTAEETAAAAAEALATKATTAEEVIAAVGVDDINSPLIEEDRDGHLKVSEGARCSLKDANEVHLAEETVEAAERAMRCVARMSIDGDEYLREMVSQVGAPPRVPSHSVLFKSAIEMASMIGSQTDIRTASTAHFTEDGIGGTKQNALSKLSFKWPSDDVKGEEESLQKEEENLTPLEVSPESHKNISPSRVPLRERASDASSGALSDALKDDYIFEDVIGGVDASIYNFDLENANVDSHPMDNVENLPVTAAPPSKGLSGGYENGVSQGDGNDLDDGMTYFARSLIPSEADLQKLNLQDGHNRVRYITHSSLRGEVEVEASIYLWTSTDRLVVSDIDGTVTKSDVWGHLMPLIGRDWTHDGICSLFSRIQQNGYRFVYLTARSVSQISMTRRFLWNIEQDGFRLPKGPVLTAPQRFFTALTQEVSKKSHLFKIACLKSVLETFPSNMRPFYAGFGNRINDVLSYAAVNIPQHKIFVIDPNSVLHVYNVKQTYKNLTHLVDVTFPPVARHRFHLSNEVAQFASLPPTALQGSQDAVGSNESSGTFSQSNAAGSPSLGVRACISSSRGASLDGSETSCRDDEAAAEVAVQIRPPKDDVPCDQEFDSFLYWRVPPKGLIAKEEVVTPKEKVKPKRQWLRFSLGSGGNVSGASNGNDSNNENITSDNTKITNKS